MSYSNQYSPSHPYPPSQKPLPIPPSSDLPTEIWIAIASAISTLHSLASLTCTCCRLHQALFPLLMRKATRIRLSHLDDMTILHWASCNGFIRVVQGLLKAGISVDALDRSGASPLMHVSKWGGVEIARYLIVHGASVDLSVDKQTPLTMAAHFNNPSILELLFHRGAEFSRQQWWTIFSAASQGHIHVMRILLRTGGVDVNFCPPHENTPGVDEYVGRTAVHLAVCNSHPEMVAFLIDNGADIDIPNNGTTPIQYLISKWPHLSPVEERCLYELCGRKRWRTILCKFNGLWKLIITKICSLGQICGQVLCLSGVLMLEFCSFGLLCELGQLCWDLVCSSCCWCFRMTPRRMAFFFFFSLLFVTGMILFGTDHRNAAFPLGIVGILGMGVSRCA